MSIKRLKSTSKTYLKRITVIIPLVCLVFILLASIYEKYTEDRSGSDLTSDIRSIDTFPVTYPIFFNDTQPSLCGEMDGSVYIGFTSDRSGHLDIWFSYSLDTINWATPRPVTSDGYNDSNPCLVRTSGGDLVLFFESDRPLENQSFNGAYSASDRYIWASFSTDGFDWRAPLQVTRNLYQQPNVYTLDTNPFAMVDGQGRLMLAYDHVSHDRANRTHSLAVCTYPIDMNGFTQRLFDTYDVALLGVGDHSMGKGKAQSGPGMGPTATLMPNGSVVLVYPGLCAYTKDLSVWYPIHPQNETIVDFFNDLSLPKFFDDGANSSSGSLYGNGRVLLMKNLDWTTWMIKEALTFKEPSIFNHGECLFVACHTPSTSDPDRGNDIWVSKVGFSAFFDPSGAGDGLGALVIGDMNDFYNQSLLHSKQGFSGDGHVYHFVLAFESDCGANSDIMISYSENGRTWSSMIAITSSVEDEREPILFEQEARVFLIYSVGSKLLSKYSTDLKVWYLDTNLPSIPPEHTKYFKRGSENHLTINESGIWTSDDASNWTLKKEMALTEPNSVSVGSDRFLISSQQRSDSSETIVIIDLHFKPAPEPSRIADTLVVIMFLVLIVLIIIALLFEIQR